MFIKTKKLFKKLKKYWFEIILMSISLIIAITSLIVFQQSKQGPKEKNIAEQSEKVLEDSDKIFVDVSGSVNNPGLYEASSSSRVKNLVDLAGGLSEAADKEFFARNFNLAQIVDDQEKIYIPSIWEVSMGYFVENSSLKKPSEVFNKINVNDATLEELDTLPDVGKVTGQKIIDNRPYGALQELINRKVISENLLEKLEDLIEI